MIGSWSSLRCLQRSQQSRRGVVLGAGDGPVVRGLLQVYIMIYNYYGLSRSELTTVHFQSRARPATRHDRWILGPRSTAWAASEVVTELAARLALLYHTNMSDLIMPFGEFFDVCFACSRSTKLI